MDFFFFKALHEKSGLTPGGFLFFVVGASISGDQIRARLINEEIR